MQHMLHQVEIRSQSLVFLAFTSQKILLVGWSINQSVEWESGIRITQPQVRATGGDEMQEKKRCQ